MLCCRSPELDLQLPVSCGPLVACSIAVSRSAGIEFLVCTGKMVLPLAVLIQ